MSTHESRGRPTSYLPEYCDLVVEYGKAGKSRTWIAAKLGVHRDTIYAWEQAHPDFSDALARAKQYEQMWWEDAGQDNLLTQGFNGSVWNRSMAARFPDEWRESTKQDVNQTGTMTVQIVSGVPRDEAAD